MTEVVRPQPIEVPGLVGNGPAWSQVSKAGNLVFVSGQVAWSEKGEVLGVGSVKEQTEIVFDNLARALEAAGSGLDLIARISIYLTDAGHIDDFRSIRDRRLQDSKPTSTLLIVSGLADPDLLVEVDAIAVTR